MFQPQPILVSMYLLCTGISAQFAQVQLWACQVQYSACPLFLPRSHLQPQQDAQLENQGWVRPEWTRVQKQVWHPAPAANKEISQVL